ncbi:DC1 - like 6 [Theobroma cacao]|nr:DC1 - like 6 [Theobroma cacao]
MASLQRASPQNPQSILHFTHPIHPLTECYIAQEYICNGCNTLGYGTAYRCPMCDFDLHEYCAACPPIINFLLHPQHVLIRVNQPGMGRVCDLCGENVDGLFFTCRVCDFDVHPLCTQLVSQVQHACHPHHPLILQQAEPRWCMACRHGCTSWRYRCHACNVDIHPECAFGPPEGPSGVPPPTPSFGSVGVPAQGPMGHVEDQVQHRGAVRGSWRRKIYFAVGKIATSVLIGSILGVPTV